ncbi:cold-shock protein [Pseudoalteromonas rhizosphaerae]|uniref:Cold-shock protein n=1 Tax=Pseudoalteromonas rhizosphaerae TaxID=2518973 RepID=A0ABW8L266_9GAMM
MLEFGKVVKYFDNGFGFIKCIQTDSALCNKEVFFHIKAVKKFESKLVEFSNGSTEDLYFWFTSKDGKKGKEVVEFWSEAENIPLEHTLTIVEKYAATLIKSDKMPAKVVSAPPSALKRIIERTLVQPAFVAKKVTNAERLSARHSLSLVKSEELSRLLIDMAEKNFRLSSELSKYITSNKLGHKYPNIAGIVTMTDEEKEWDFDGGFPKEIYRIICQELSLTDKGTSARAIGFTSYQDQKNEPDIIL